MGSSIKTYFQLLMLSMVVVQLSSCGWVFGDKGMFRDRGNDYRKARVEPVLQTPTNMDSHAIDDSYAIPPINDRSSLNAAEFVIPRPEPLDADVDRDAVRINTLASQQWILVNGTPGAIWPKLRGFLSLNQLTVQRADAVSGMLETAWIKPEAKNLPQERYRLRIEQGVQRGTSELYVLQANTSAKQDRWPDSSSNSEREKLMVKSLAQYLADSATTAAVSMLAQQAIDSSGKVTIELGENEQPYIKLKLPFSRAWAAISRALDKSGYGVDDLDRSKQMYFVHYQAEKDEDEKKGFFSSLFSFSDDKNENKNTAYIINVTEINDKEVSISVQRQNNETLEQGEAERVLKAVKRHIS